MSREWEVQLLGGLNAVGTDLVIGITSTLNLKSSALVPCTAQTPTTSAGRRVALLFALSIRRYSKSRVINMTQTLYVGNLPPEADQEALQLVFGQYGGLNSVTMKGSYAFVVFEETVDAEKALNSLNGADMLGSVLVVQPSHQQRANGIRQISMGKVEVGLIPSHISWLEVQGTLSTAGNILHSQLAEAGDGQNRTYSVVFETLQQAELAAQQFNGADFQGIKLRVKFVEEMRPSTPPSLQSMSPGQQSGQRMIGGGHRSRSVHTEFPLRILVPSDMVGAIIGREGNTIRMLTQKTKARVDVHRKENPGALEKAVTILGTEDSCSSACYEILKIMQDEVIATTGYYENGLDRIHPLPAIPLKVLAHDDLIGRLIGKGGYSLKKIATDTNTRVNISKQSDLTPWNMERTVTITGTIENSSRAEREVSRRLRQFYEDDMAKLVHQAMPMLGAKGNVMSRGGSHSPGSMSPSPPQYSSNSTLGSSSPLSDPVSHWNDTTDSPEEKEIETVYMYIPSVFFHMVFGPRGSNIPAMNRLSKATIKICRGSERDPEMAVRITGPAEAQWKAQLCIFNHLKEEGMANGKDVRLTVEVLVPFNLIDKLTGRGSAMIQDIQTQTGALLNVPRVVTDSGEIPVQIYGSFQSSQTAQQRLRLLVSRSISSLSASSSPPPISPQQKYLPKPLNQFSALSPFPLSSLNPWAPEFHLPL
ncbi:insulin-like growth factor 2 mRNA-binding protein 2 isoform X2 [Corticium candelabrum]|uniref:insulin-like growth factor 2 mRNA-binding protein 2 isoform X2 n=1 Tax=Corticium candelabrum TaxID=121492 RepID=UPI002E2581ED|nr:insulin-like growth factor 2 mRNA-binding protein 2 isoform X2 [Corticium candelabrum]